MVVRWLGARLSRAPGASDYLAATGLAAAALLCRAAIEAIVPGTTSFLIMLPAVVLAGVFCGTAPAALAAMAGGSAIAALFPEPHLLTGPPFNASHVDLLTFAVGCATILLSTGVARRFAADAATAEARLAEVFRQIPGAAAILEAPTGKLLLRSRLTNEVLQQTERAIQSADEMASFGGVHDDGRPFAPGDYPIVRALRSGEVVSGERLNYRHPDGKIVVLEVHAGPVRAPNGTMVAAVGMAFDVSARVEAERRLRESEALHRATVEKLRAALDAGELGLWELDLAARTVRMDAAMAAMVGLAPVPIDMTRDAFHALIDPEFAATASDRFDAAVAAGGAYADEYRIVTPLQASRWLVLRGVVLGDVGKAVGVASDVTERREREEALRDALSARDVLMREADHRIKNSLQMVVSLLELQARKTSDPDTMAALRAAMTRVNAVGIVHLALQESPDLRTIQLAAMLRDLCARVGSLNPALTLECDATDDDVWLDAEQAIPLGLIASELLTNALRHAFAPGSHGQVNLQAGITDGMLAMTVADNGAGMPATVARRGLGTAVIQTLTRQIGATMAVVSEPGAGTAVSVRLPVGTARCTGEQKVAIDASR
jgi:two-component sensor histidine kinase/PAS domain-containing protein